MTNQKLIESLKEYIDNNNIEKKDIEFPKRGDTEISLQEVKQDYENFADLTISLFCEFRNNFKDCNKAKDIILGMEIFTIELVKLRWYKHQKVEYGKGKAKRDLMNFINDNYFKLMEFFDLCVEVYLT